MDYNARMYDNLHARVVPPDMDKEPQYWHTTIHDEFNWKIAPDFTLDELRLICQAGTKIRSRVNEITDGRGSAWMNGYLGGTTFKHGEFPFTHHSYVRGTTVLLRPAWQQNRDWTHIVHELGHVYDDNTGGFCWAVICGSGNADRLQKVLGGHPTGVRFLNGTRGVPRDYRWPEGWYGNKATAEYFAEAFMYMMSDPGKVPDPLNIVMDALRSFMVAEAAILP